MKDLGIETFATAIQGVETDGVGTPIPAEISNVLEQYEDLMPDELLKVLPPRRVVDHAIELEPGKEPPAKAQIGRAHV